MLNFRVVNRAAVLAVVLLAACGTEPVQWQAGVAGDDERPSPLSFPTPQAFDATLPDTASQSTFAHTQDLLRDAGAQSMLSEMLAAMPDSGASALTRPKAMSHDMDAMHHAVWGDLGMAAAPMDSARCGRSLRTVYVPGTGRVAAWWSKRSRNRVALVAAWRFGDEHDTTSSWRGPIVVDTLDNGPSDANAHERGAVGCQRAAPGLAADERPYVHVSYAMNAVEGPGVFYAHQMDPRSGFEPPQVIMYGDYLGTTRVAASGDRVVVAYEDPNTQARTQIGVALSNTSGHGFTDRVTASSSSGIARDPYVVIRGRALVVGWSDLPSSSTELPNFRLRRGVLR